MVSVGRPTKYIREYSLHIIDFMSTGRSLTAFAAHISVSKDTIYEWIKNHPEFSDAVAVAKTKCEAFWEQKGIEGLFIENNRRLNTSLWTFYMKCRFGWREENSENTNPVITLNYRFKDPEEKADSI